MEFGRLVTLTFDKNVGALDRVVRCVSGAAMVVAGALVDAPGWANASLVVLGGMWFATGVLSKCSIYYMLGYSTCPIPPTGGG